jgi:hypothetical protein
MEKRVAMTAHVHLWAGQVKPEHVHETLDFAGKIFRKSLAPL